MLILFETKYLLKYVFHLFVCRVEGGELFDKVVSISQYDEPTAKLLFYQMVSACSVSLVHYKAITITQLPI